MTTTTTNEFAKKALQLVHKVYLTAEEAREVTTDVVAFWRAHVNEGFLTYRKSMGDDDTEACLDWRDGHPGTVWFEDIKGDVYLDCLSGFGIFNVGHRHPTVVHAVAAQLYKQPMHSQEFLDPLRAYAARLLSTIMPSPDLTHVFFVNSGTEAVEAALKMAMLHTGRSRIAACLNAFHGKTLGSLAATSKASFRAPFANAIPRASHTAFNDVAALTALFDAAAFSGERYAALIIEPVQGEGGVHVASRCFLEAARRLCDEHGTCLVLDEVQSGFGRTGKWFACEHSGVVPDLLCIGKSAGGGVMPVSACCGTARIWEKYVANPFLFTSTFGGNPMAMAAVIATVNVILDEGLLDNAASRGAEMKGGLLAMAARFPDIVKEVRGTGLMLGVEFTCNAHGVAWASRLLRRRVLVSGTLISATSIRVCPPLVITREQVQLALAVMMETCGDIRKQLQQQRQGLGNSKL
jgi:putrescine aminotransferase